MQSVILDPLSDRRVPSQSLLIVRSHHYHSPDISSLEHDEKNHLTIAYPPQIAVINDAKSLMAHYLLTLIPHDLNHARQRVALNTATVATTMH